MKKQIVKKFILVKKVRHLPRQSQPPPPPTSPRRVLVVGRCTLDMITVCDEQPISGKLQRTEEGFWRLGGHAANICSVLRRLGTDVEYLGQLSSIAAFESLASSFQATGIDISNCPRTPQQPAHQSIIVVRGHDKRTTVEYCKRQHELTYQQFVGAVDYQKYAWIHFEARNPKETFRMMHAVLEYNLRSLDTNIVLSVNLTDLRPLSLLMAQFADYVLIHKQIKTTYGYMNGRETVFAVRDKMHIAYNRWLAKQPKKIPNSTECKPQSNCTVQERHEPILIYDNYSEGASCLMPDGTYFKVGSHKPQKIVDTIGEHATFVGAVIHATEKNKMSLRDVIEYGTRATCLKISQYGFDSLRCMPKDLNGCYWRQ